MQVKIITDSGSDLPKEIIDKYEVEVLPFHIILDDGIYLDNVNLKPQELFERMRAGAVPKTSQITPEDFKEVFSKYAEKGEECLYIGFSSGLSGTFESSLVAKREIKEKYPDFNIELIDTSCGSLAHGLLVYRAAIMASEGGSIDDITEEIKWQSSNMEHIFTLDDLEYLYRGGRISRSNAFFGGLLHIKPILHITDGVIVPLEKIKGKKKALKRILDIMEERGSNLSEQLIAISHADDYQTAKILKDMIQEKFKCKEFLIDSVGCVTGSHLGLGGVGVFFLSDYK